MLDVVSGEIGKYSTMLKRIAVFTGIATFLVTWILRIRIPRVDTALNAIALPISLGPVTSALGPVIPALLVAFLSRAITLHNLVSDVFRIRRRFDVHQILFPLALRTCSWAFTRAQLQALKAKRPELMSSVFYKYASSSEGKAAIDVHVIRMALDHWSWYWVTVEAMVVGTSGTLALAAAGDWKAAAMMGGVSLVGGTGLLRLLGVLCDRTAEQQIDLIVADDTRRAEIGQVFRAL